MPENDSPHLDREDSEELSRLFRLCDAALYATIPISRIFAAEIAPVYMRAHEELTQRESVYELERAVLGLPRTMLDAAGLTGEQLRLKLLLADLAGRELRDTVDGLVDVQAVAALGAKAVDLLRKLPRAARRFSEGVDIGIDSAAGLAGVFLPWGGLAGGVASCVPELKKAGEHAYGWIAEKKTDRRTHSWREIEESLEEIYEDAGRELVELSLVLSRHVR